MTPAARTVLVVEDDPAIRRGLVDALRFAGYAVTDADDGRAGLDLALGMSPDLVLLDVILPKLDGFAVLAELRRARPQMPVILVTARGAEPDRVHGLRGGADDYVVKPFSATELLARVEAVLRRSASRPLDVATAKFGARTVDFERREVRGGPGGAVSLSEKECELLRYLARNAGRAVSRDELLQNVWGLDPKGVETRTVDMHVARLREKLGDDPESPEAIATVRGKGYMAAKP
ncbi:MAG: Transcriptional regulatory protein WalR [Planctomycetes bacterium]|nr:Transcriptional regulatory protein WalR [Planctomycetota bacterium]